MSDFLLDFRGNDARREAARKACALLRFCAETRTEVLERSAFTLVLARVDDPALWGPCASVVDGRETLVALGGRVALEEHEWEAARREPGAGGLACKVMLKRYREGGIDALRSLNGNFLALVYDERAATFHLVTDRCGMYLAYGQHRTEAPLVYSSHPDVLASILGEDQHLDLTSLAEFLTTGRLTFPYTYYRNLEAVQPGCIYTFSLATGVAEYDGKRPYFRFDCQVKSDADESDLAEQLARAFTSAVWRRTLPIFGTTGIGLSGGLDSRAILAVARKQPQVRAFTLFDGENAETRTATSLAHACGVELIPIRRDFDYYANSAELGVRISGGTGNIASNHFLGIQPRLSQFGIQNLVTGCYCDYLLKGLALNTAERMLTRQERLGEFDVAFYRPHFPLATAVRQDVDARLHARFPEAGKPRLSEEDWFNIQCKRAFPLAYEGDLTQRVIPQRVLPWFLPIVDNDILETFLRIPVHLKLNASLFSQMVLILSDRELRRIPDSNTGAQVATSGLVYSFHRYLSALRNQVKGKLLPGMATRGSWPNWDYYIRRSRVLQMLWQRENEYARELFLRLLGHDPFGDPFPLYSDKPAEFSMRLFTLKLWLDQRVAGSPQDVRPSAIGDLEARDRVCLRSV